MLDGIPLGNLTAPALLGMAVLMVLLGVLVPKYIYKEKVAEAEKWRKAYETEKEARVIANEQTAELLELAKTTHTIIVAMFGTVAGQSRHSGEADVVSTPTGK